MSDFLLYISWDLIDLCAFCVGHFPLNQTHHLVDVFVDPFRHNTGSPVWRKVVILFITVLVSNRLSNADLIFRLNICSAGKVLSIVFRFGAYKRPKIAEVNLPSPLLHPWFFKALLKASTNVSAHPFDLGWYGGVDGLLSAKFSCRKQYTIICYYYVRNSKCGKYFS